MIFIKKHILYLILILTISCSDNKYNGTWIISTPINIIQQDIPDVLKITNDSISVRYTYYDTWKTYPLNKRNNHLFFEAIKWRVEEIGDTLKIGNSIRYYKSRNIPYSPKLELPNIVNSNFVKSGLNDVNIAFLGVILKDSIPYAYYNDTLFDIDNFPVFYDRGLSNIAMYIDRNIKMSDLEKIFFNFSEFRSKEIKFINSIAINDDRFSNSFFNYEICSFNIYPYYIDQDYYNKIYNNNLLLPPPPRSPIRLNIKESETIILKLKNNEVTFNDETIPEKRVFELLNNAFDSKMTVLCLYGLESNYLSFLKLNSYISTFYNKKKNEQAIALFNQNYKALDIMKRQHIDTYSEYYWQFSIPYYEEVLSENIFSETAH